MSFTTIRVESADAVTTITLDRPAKLNSFNETMHAELRDALTAIENDTGVRAVLLTGAGRGFCAGQDLADVLPDKDTRGNGDGGELGDILERNYNPLVRRLRALDRPIVAAVNGVAAGAGANIALACDIVIAARSAKFIQAFCKIGLVPDSAGTYTLPRLVGPARAAGLAMLGEAIDAETAAQWGLIWKSVDDDTLMTEADGLARHLATQPTRALGLIKRALNESENNDLDAQLDLEYELQRMAASTDDYAEGVAAFLAKRPPVFRGR